MASLPLAALRRWQASDVVLSVRAGDDGEPLRALQARAHHSHGRAQTSRVHSLVMPPYSLLIGALPRLPQASLGRAALLGEPLPLHLHIPASASPAALAAAAQWEWRRPHASKHLHYRVTAAHAPGLADDAVAAIEAWAPQSDEQVVVLLDAARRPRVKQGPLPISPSLAPPRSSGCR